jgi:hypothetical protein
LRIPWEGVYTLCSPLINDHPEESVALAFPGTFSVSRLELLYPREYYCRSNLAAEALIAYGGWDAQHRIETIFGWKLDGSCIRSVATLEHGAYFVWLANGEQGIVIDANHFDRPPFGGTYHVCCHYYRFPAYEALFQQLYPDWIEALQKTETIDALFALRPSRIDLSQASLQRKTLTAKTKQKQRCVLVSCFRQPRETRYDWQLVGDWSEYETKEIESYLLQLRRWHPGAFFLAYKYERYIHLVCHLAKRSLFFEGESVYKLVQQAMPLMTPSSTSQVLEVSPSTEIGE